MTTANDGLVCLQFNLMEPLGLELAKDSALVLAVVAGGQGEAAGVGVGSCLVGIGDERVSTVVECAAAIGRLRATGHFVAGLTFDSVGGNPLRLNFLAQEAAALPDWISSPPPLPPPVPREKRVFATSKKKAPENTNKGNPRRHSWWQVLVGSGKGTPKAPNGYRERIVALYEHYGMPDKAAKVDEYLVKYRGKEEGMIGILVNKYGPEPPPRWVPQATRSTERQQAAAASATKPTSAAESANKVGAAGEGTVRASPLRGNKSDLGISGFLSPPVPPNSREQIRAMLAARRNSERDQKELAQLRQIVGTEPGDDDSYLETPPVARTTNARGAEVTNPVSNLRLQGRLEQKQQKQQQTAKQQQRGPQPPFVHEPGSPRPPKGRPSLKSLHKQERARSEPSEQEGSPTPAAEEALTDDMWTETSFGFGAIQATTAGLSSLFG